MAATAHLPHDHDSSRLAVGEQLGADLEPGGIVTRLVDDECAVDSVRATDAADRNEARAQSAISST